MIYMGPKVVAEGVVLMIFVDTVLLYYNDSTGITVNYSMIGVEDAWNGWHAMIGCGI